MLSLNSIKRTHHATPQTPQSMLLNLFAVLPPSVLSVLVIVLFGFFTFILKDFYDSLKGIRKDVTELRIYVQSSIERYENQNIRLNNLETEVKELREKITQLQIQTK